MARLATDWRAYGGELGSLLASAGLDHVLGTRAAPVDVVVETTHHLLPPIPWELASLSASLPIVMDPRVASFTRSAPSRAEGMEDVRYAQSTLSRLMGISTAADGILGPQTEELVRTFQRDAGLPDHGGVDQATLAAIRRRAIDADPSRHGSSSFGPASNGRSSRARRGLRDATFGVDLYRLYESRAIGSNCSSNRTSAHLPRIRRTHRPRSSTWRPGSGSPRRYRLARFREGFTKASCDESEWTASLVGSRAHRKRRGPLWSWTSRGPRAARRRPASSFCATGSRRTCSSSSRRLPSWRRA